MDRWPALRWHKKGRPGITPCGLITRLPVSQFRRCHDNRRATTKVPRPLGISDVRLGEPSTPGALGSGGKDHLMMLYQEKISPPLAPLSEEEQMKLTIASKDRWAKGLIARIAVVIRDIQQH